MCKVNKFHSNLQQAQSSHPKLIFSSKGCKNISDTEAADATKNSDTKYFGTHKRPSGYAPLILSKISSRGC